jgi:hypothetical protein
MKRLARIAALLLAGLILADLVPALILDATRNIGALSYQVSEAYADWKCESGAHFMTSDGVCYTILKRANGANAPAPE